MYTIKQAAIRSGVGVSLLRAWERRYGVVNPARTAGGYRLYDDVAIARLRAMRELVDAGWAASQAAETVIKAPDAEIAAIRAAPGLPAAPDSEALVVAAAAYDAAGLERALDDMFARGSYESVIDDVVLRALAAVGDAWAEARIDVACEHLASAAVHRRLAALFDQGGFAGAGRSVLVGLPPGSRHEIGLLAFAIALRRRRANVLYLGADVPIASWIPATANTRVEVAVVGVPMSADIPAARQVVDALARVRPELLALLGGPAATKAGSGDMRVLPFRVTDAAAEVARLVGNS